MNRQYNKIFIDDSNADNRKGEIMKEIYLAGGCFWGMQKFLDGADGVIQTRVGYANGPFLHPAYSDVKRGSGHAETCKVVFDESVLPLASVVVLISYLVPSP